VPRHHFPQLISLLLLAGTGCSELSRHRECRRLADAVNPLLADIETRGEATDPSASGYIGLAEAYRKLRGVVRKLDIQDERLDDATEAYLEMVTAAEKQLRRAASAIHTNKGNKDKIDSAELLRRHQVAMSPVLAQQGTAIGRLRGLCKP
jgi:hypothetical protein